MKILYWAPSSGITLSQSGGAGTHIRGMVKGLRNAGCEVLPVVGGDICKHAQNPTIGEKTENQTNEKLRETIKSISPSYLKYLIRDLRILRHKNFLMRKKWKTIVNFSPDLVYERSTYLIDEGLKIARTLGIPYILESDVKLVEFIKEEFGTALGLWGNRIEQGKHEYADAIFVMAEAAKDELVRKRHISPGKIFVKGLGVDKDLFKLDEIKRKKIEEKFNIQDKIVVGFLGVFRKYHRIDLLLEVAKILQGKDKKVHFLIIGYGDPRDEYRKFIREHSITNVEFTGEIDYNDVPAYLAALDICVIPGCAAFMYPVKVLEYGAMKKPVIVPGYRAFDNLIKDGYNGLFFEPNSAHSLAKAIVRLASSLDERKVYGERFYKKVIENYTWDKIGEKTLKIIKSTLKGGESERYHEKRHRQKIP